MDMISLGILGAIACGLIIYSIMPRKTSERDTIKRRLTGDRGNNLSDIQEQARLSATSQLVRKATPVLSKLIVPSTQDEQTNLRSKLMSAGYRRPQAQTVFLGSKTILAIVALITSAFTCMSTGQELPMLLGTVTFATGVSFMLPNVWLSLAVSSRQQKIRQGLPDTLDLLVVSVESGLALDAAFKRVGEEMAMIHTELSEELRIATMEGQMGIPRGEAMENMARRCGIEELRNLVSVVLQAEKFGTSIARALRNQADSLRTKRHQAAEERAQKTAVKLMIPLVMFIFPAMGVVLGGPAAIRMMRALQDNPSLGG